MLGYQAESIRDTANAPRRPSAEPRSASLSPEARTMRVTSLTRAPSANRIANSLSLKEGEQPFLDQARAVRRLGAAAVVMAFDEHGQAETANRKVEILGRAYDLLVADGFAPEDIVLDPNVLAVATGIEEHAGFAKAFLEATSRLQERCPGALVSGGVSNLSFAFRGNDAVREAMHASFLSGAMQVWSLTGMPAESRAITQTLFTWITSGDFTLDLSFRLDTLSAVMVSWNSFPSSTTLLATFRKIEEISRSMFRTPASRV